MRALNRLNHDEPSLTALDSWLTTRYCYQELFLFLLELYLEVILFLTAVNHGKPSECEIIKPNNKRLNPCSTTWNRVKKDFRGEALFKSAYKVTFYRFGRMIANDVKETTLGLDLESVSQISYLK